MAAVHGEHEQSRTQLEKEEEEEDEEEVEAQKRYEAMSPGERNAIDAHIEDAKKKRESANKIDERLNSNVTALFFAAVAVAANERKEEEARRKKKHSLICSLVVDWKTKGHKKCTITINEDTTATAHGERLTPKAQFHFPVDDNNNNNDVINYLMKKKPTDTNSIIIPEPLVSAFNTVIHGWLPIVQMFIEEDGCRLKIDQPYFNDNMRVTLTYRSSVLGLIKYTPRVFEISNVKGTTNFTIKTDIDKEPLTFELNQIYNGLIPHIKQHLPYRWLSARYNAECQRITALEEKMSEMMKMKVVVVV